MTIWIAYGLVKTLKGDRIISDRVMKGAGEQVFLGEVRVMRGKDLLTEQESRGERGAEDELMCFVDDGIDLRDIMVRVEFFESVAVQVRF